MLKAPFVGVLPPSGGAPPPPLPTGEPGDVIIYDGTSTPQAGNLYSFIDGTVAHFASHGRIWVGGPSVIGVLNSNPDPATALSEQASPYFVGAAAYWDGAASQGYQVGWNASLGGELAPGLTVTYADGLVTDNVARFGYDTPNAQPFFSQGPGSAAVGSYRVRHAFTLYGTAPTLGRDLRLLQQDSSGGVELLVLGHENAATFGVPRVRIRANSDTSIDRAGTTTSVLKVDGTGFGAFNVAPVAQPVVSGANAEATLASLVSALSALGWISGTPTTSKKTNYWVWGANVWPAVAAGRFPSVGTTAVSTVEGVSVAPAACPGTMTDIRAWTSAVSATDTLAQVARLNGVDTAITCTIAIGGSSASGSGSVPYSAGDRWTMQWTQSGNESVPSSQPRTALAGTA